jgi:hypothetical protein
MMDRTENTLYILENLSTTESKDLEYVEIDVYYEDEQGNEGAAQYDMPAIADDAISTINQLKAKIAELEKENKELEDCFDDCYAELGKVQHELNGALKVRGFTRTKQPNKGM